MSVLAPAAAGSVLDVEQRHRYALARSLLPTGGVALVLDCGAGDGAAVLARAAGRVIAVDPDASSVDLARERHASIGNLEFRCASAVSPGLRQRGVDLIVWTAAPRTGAALDAVLATIARLLRPAGVALLAGADNHLDTAWNQAVSRHFRHQRALLQRAGTCSDIFGIEPGAQPRRLALLADDGVEIAERSLAAPDSAAHSLLLVGQDPLPPIDSLMLAAPGDAAPSRETDSLAPALQAALQAQQAHGDELRQQLASLRASHDAELRRARDEQDRHWSRRVQERDQLLRTATQQIESLQRRQAEAEAALASAEERQKVAASGLADTEARLAQRLASRQAELESERRRYIADIDALRAAHAVALDEASAAAASDIRALRDEAAKDLRVARETAETDMRAVRETAANNVRAIREEAASERATWQDWLLASRSREQDLQRLIDESRVTHSELRQLLVETTSRANAAEQQVSGLEDRIAELEEILDLTEEELREEQERARQTAARASDEASALRAGFERHRAQLESELFSTRQALQQAQVAQRRADARAVDLAHRLEEATRRRAAELADWLSMFEGVAASLEHHTEQALLQGVALDDQALHAMRTQLAARQDELRRKLPALPAPAQAPGSMGLTQLLSKSPEDFVQTAYRLLLGRPADADGRRHYVERLEQGEPKLRVLTDLRLSAEGRGRTPEVARLDEALRQYRLTRIPLWGRQARRRLQTLIGTATPALPSVVASGEARQLDELRTSIDQLTRGSSLLAESVPIAVALGAAPSALEIDSWNAARELVDSDLGTFVDMAYATLLLRPPTTAEREAEFVRLGRGASRVFVIEQLIRSEECQGRFSPGSALGVLAAPDVASQPVTAALEAPETPDPSPQLSVIVVAIGTSAAVLRRGLRSLSSQPAALSTEVIVVIDRAGARRLSGLEGVRLVTVEDGADTAALLRACDLGAKAAQGRLLGFMSGGLQSTPDTWNELAATLDVFSGTGVAGGQCTNQDPDSGPDERLSARPVADLSWNGSLVPRHLFEALGGWARQTDGFGAALAARGYRCVFQPLAVFRSQTLQNSSSSLGVPLPPPADRPRFLVVEEAMLQPDRDAGSLCVFNLMLLWREQGWQPVFACRAGEMPATRQVSLLRRCGIEVVIGGESRIDAHLAAEGPRYSAIMLCRPDPMTVFAASVRRHAPNARLLYFAHDLHHLRMAREAAARGESGLGVDIENMRQRELACARAADLTLLLSDAEQAIIQGEDPTIRTALSPMPHDFTRGMAEPLARRGAVFVGSFAHPPNRDAVRWLCEEIMPLLQRRRPALEVIVVGADPPADLVAGAPAGVRFAGAVADLDTLLGSARMALAPLRAGAGVKGKVLRAAAAGVPVVGTKWAFEGLALRDGEHVLQADDAHSLADAMARLDEDPGLWQRLANAAHAALKSSHGPDAAAQRLDALLAAAGLPSHPTGYPARLLREQSFYPGPRTKGSLASNPTLSLST